MKSLAIARARRTRRQKSLRSASQAAHRTVLVAGFLAAAALVISVLGGVLVYSGLTAGLPPVEEMQALLDPRQGLLLQPTRLYDRTGSHLLAVLSPVNSPRTYIPYSKFPESFVQATLAVTQPGFWASPGYQLSGWRDPLTHPTLAQRMAADLLLWQDPASATRAIHERMLAAQMTARFGRQQVLEWYLNSADYGRYAYGAEAAAQLYLGKSVSRVDLSEAALLAAIGQAPALNPLDAPDGIEARRIQVLQAMLDLGWITPDETAQAILEKPTIQAPPRQAGIGNTGDLAPAFVSYVLSQLGTRYGSGRAERGGLSIYTSLDYDLQLQAECLLRTEQSRLAGSTQPVLTQEKGPCSTGRLLAPLSEGQTLTDGMASAIITDPHTGEILAEVGDMRSGRQVDGLAPHPAGTSITPFIYLTGFSRGFSPASLAWDIPAAAPSLGQVYHGPVRLRTALVNDYLIPANNLLDQMSQESVETIATSFGVEVPPEAHLLQDDFELSPLSLAGAYGIFASGGLQAGQAGNGVSLAAVSILKITGADHSTWAETSTSQDRSVVSPQLAYMMNQVLSDESARWPSLGHPNPLEIGRPAAARISPALDGSGAWTVGYTPERVAIIWQGTSPSTALENAAPVSVSDLSGRLWHALMQYALQDLPAEGWKTPPGIVTVPVCDPSGLLPTSACPNVVSEIFLDGRQPVQADDLYQTVQVNIETGLLATIFTHPELVEPRTYMVIPPQAREWAHSAGIPAPPAAYDTVQKPPLLPDVQITTPQMFSDGHGTIELFGKAAGDGFLSYRLEYGQGLYPQSWIQIGSDSTIPVSGGTLGSWDTSGLNGLYALRLMVVRQDQRVDQALVQVTLDNSPPQLAITYPAEGQVILLKAEPQVTLQAQAADPFLTAVEFYLDGVQLGSSSQAPYGLVWKARAGQHDLRVVALDRAGNSTEATIHFNVK